MNDIVYILKTNAPPNELRYSLRSVVKNFPYSRVWFYCGCPAGIEPDIFVAHDQIGDNKWEKVRSSLLKIMDNDDISEDFWLFNDDFFVMKPVTEQPPPYICGSLMKRVTGIEANGGASGYSRQLFKANKQLLKAGYDTLDYALHIPMLINRKKAKEALELFPDIPMFRSVYGNVAKIGGVVRKDVKVFTNDIFDEDSDYLSTNERSFSEGKVGKYIRECFPQKCKYEQDY